MIICDAVCAIDRRLTLFVQHLNDPVVVKAGKKRGVRNKAHLLSENSSANAKPPLKAISKSACLKGYGGTFDRAVKAFGKAHIEVRNAVGFVERRLCDSREPDDRL